MAPVLRTCPICRSRFRRFARSYEWADDRGICPRCGSRQRHRHLWLFLERHTDLFDGRPRRVLHFAPEAGIRTRLGEVKHLDYVTVDIEEGRADVAADVQALPFADGEFDVILCVHVLEHIPDDRRALAELHRVLRPGGWAILQVPIQGEHTDEDPSVTDPEERQRRFGQDDHVRMYGRDFEDRVRAAGFDLDVRVFRDELSARERRVKGLNYRMPWDVDFNAIREPWEVFVASRPAA